MDISTSEITSKKYVETMWIFRPSILHQKKYVETTWIFRSSKLHHKKYVQTTWIFRSSKLHQQKYVETTWTFQPSILYQKKYVETTWIFRPSKSRRKNYVDFSINQITLKNYAEMAWKFVEIWPSTYWRNIRANRGWLSVGCPLGSVHQSNHLKLW